MTDYPCPCCARGQIVDNVCTHCGVGIASGSAPSHVVHRTHYKRRGDQNEMRPMADYVSTKQDK
jgi:hypothetical protein